ncbi:hypothetical protein AC249_AIPGENE25759 [Exaiptasia diaphana]|nr:hypothetical protein AC249_AIPGENE25759 [Exaiptasia diaphana]
MATRVMVKLIALISTNAHQKHTNVTYKVNVSTLLAPMCVIVRLAIISTAQNASDTNTFKDMSLQFLGGLENSSIMTNYGNDSYFQALSAYLNPVLKHNDSYWLKCWHGQRDGFKATTFHALCDGKGPTVMIVNVKTLYIFGGYVDVSWHSNEIYSSSDAAFLFSLYNNPNGFQPVKLNIIDKNNAIYGNAVWGPTFGRGKDLYVGSEAQIKKNSLAFAKSYETPPGCTTGVNCNFMADTYQFFVHDIEMFYEMDGSTM